jgi:hypothetical protein
VAACVAALGLFLTLQVFHPPVQAPPTAPVTRPGARGPAAPVTGPASAIPAAPTGVPAPSPSERAAAVPAARRAVQPAARVAAPAVVPSREAAAGPSTPVAADGLPTAPPPLPPAPTSVVVTAERRAPAAVPAPPLAIAPPRPGPAPAEKPADAGAVRDEQAQGGAATAPTGAGDIVVTGAKAEAHRARPPGGRADPAARLRAAAAAGRTAELARLLDAGVPADAPDAAGDTALIESVRADRPAVAALLRRHGADLDLRNGAGESARDIARAKADPALDRALGLTP